MRHLGTAVLKTTGIAFLRVWLIKLIPALIFMITAGTPLFPKPIQLTLAILNLYGGNQNSKALDPVLNNPVDVLVLIEWNGSPHLRAKLVNYTFRVDLPESGASGMAILTKDIPAHGTVIQNPVPGPCALPFAGIAFTLGDSDITVIGVHAPPPVNYCRETTEETITAIQDWITNGRLNRSIGSIAASDHLIIAGDLNALPWSPVIRNFKYLGMVDTATRCNQIIRGTWSPNRFIPKLARIDYIFAPQSFTIKDSKTVRIPGSDHRGVYAIIEVPSLRSAIVTVTDRQIGNQLTTSSTRALFR
jgi:endonuclease/exonuclease/phosphatase (EEP) superfamily protein YafD